MQKHSKAPAIAWLQGIGKSLLVYLIIWRVISWLVGSSDEMDMSNEKVQSVHRGLHVL